MTPGIQCGYVEAASGDTCMALPSYTLPWGGMGSRLRAGQATHHRENQPHDHGLHQPSNHAHTNGP